MATFSELQTKVSKRLLDANNTAVSSADVAASINDAIRYWKKHKFWFNIIDDTVNVTAQNATLPVTGDVLVPARKDGAFVIAYSNMRYPLTKISENIFNSWYLDNGYGIPRYYARVGQDYLMYPLPDRNYDLIRSYYKDYDDLVQPTDTNDFTINADRLIVLWASAECNGELRQDDKMEGYFTAKALNEAKELQTFTGKIQSSGRLTINSSLI